MQRLDAAVQRLLQHLDVVGDAVVGALRQRQDPRLLVLRRAGEGIRLDPLLDAVGMEFPQRNRADDAEVVARRRQEYGNRAGHRDRMQDRHVAIAIDDRDVAGCDVGVPDHLVRRRRAVGDEVAVVGVEDARRVALGGGDRARVIEQLPQLVDGIADVGAQHVLAEELVEHLADRALEEGDAARVAGTVPRVGAVLRVVDERTEERWGERVEIGFHLANDVPRDEFRRVLEHVDEAMQLAQHVVRNVPRRARFPVEVDRDLGVLEADLGDELAQVEDGGIELRTWREFLVVDRQDEGGGAALLLRELREVAVARDAEHLHAFLLDRRRERANAEARSVLGAEVLVDDDERKAELHGAGLLEGGRAAPVARAGERRRELSGESRALAMRGAGRSLPGGGGRCWSATSGTGHACSRGLRAGQAGLPDQR